MKHSAGNAALFTAVAVLILTLFSSAFAGLQQTGTDDKTLSPYFFVQSDNPGLDQMPLKSTKADVTIVGVIADVTVTQVYRNQGRKTLEAVYVFPASTRAAVYGMKMTIGKRIIEAKIKKKDEARQEYEQAKSQGKSASLLEQQRPNVFQMNVANILPNDTIKVELRYTELLIPTDKTYEFVYPTVVGPRYSNQAASTAPASEKWVENPHLHQGAAPTYAFDITVNLATGLPVRKLTCTSHKVKVGYEGPARATVSLDSSESRGGNRDYVLKYQLSGDKIESGLLLSQGGKENFFLLMVQPPKKVVPANMPGREYIFIVDVSGSMHGFPLDISKRLFRELITGLRPADRFNVLLFAGGSAVLAEQSLTATPENIRRGVEFIEKQQGGGGTELLPALKRALSLPKAEGFSRSVVIATDGYVTVEEEVFDLIRNNLNKANMFTFGIGTSVNRHLLEGMARVGMGEPFVIAKAEEAGARADAFRKIIQSPLLTNIRVSYEGFNAYDIEPLSIPDVLAERPVVLFGKWRGKPEGRITVKGIAGNGSFKETIDVGKSMPPGENTSLRYLWARHRISLLSDYNRLRQDGKRTAEVTRLGLDYNLLTAYTSFVAVDSRVRNNSGEQTTVRQPLPMPEGVSNYAVGQAVPAVAPARKSMHQSMPAAVGESILGALSPEVQSRQDAAKPEVKSKESDVRTNQVIDISTTGALSKDALNVMIEKNLKTLRACSGNKALQGTVVFEVMVNAQGKVTKVVILSGGPADKGVKDCIMKQIKQWNFPAGGQTGAATIRFTVSF